MLPGQCKLYGKRSAGTFSSPTFLWLSGKWKRQRMFSNLRKRSVVHSCMCFVHPPVPAPTRGYSKAGICVHISKSFQAKKHAFNCWSNCYSVYLGHL